MRLSTRNQLRGRVVGIEEGNVTATVTVDISGQTVTSSITLAGLAAIDISEGSEVVVLIKASDVMLGVDD